MRPSRWKATGANRWIGGGHLGWRFSRSLDQAMNAKDRTRQRAAQAGVDLHAQVLRFRDRRSGRSMFV